MGNFVSWVEFLEVFNGTEEVKMVKRDLEGEKIAFWVVIDERRN